MDTWSEWTDCKLKNGRCGEGSKTRQRSVLIDSKCNGQVCEPKNETSLCYGPCCVTDCQVGPWSEFGFCSTTCGEGKRNRTRNVLVLPSCGGALCPEVIEFTSCTAQNLTDCSFTGWSQWSACSNDCGNGTNIRTRTLLTPAYCGGKCLDESREQQRACESYAARKDCQVGPWSEWSTCIRDCERGIQRSTRVINVTEACGGLSCTGRYNLTQTRACHEKCTQLCNQGKCSCNTGYVLLTDGYTCRRRNCSSPGAPGFCGVGTQIPVSCRPVYVSCNVNGTLFGDVCNVTCGNAGWVVKGEPKSLVCKADGTWSQPAIFCGPSNKAPVNISINSTSVSELLTVDRCFAKLTTATDNEAWDKHTYSVLSDPTGALKAKDDLLCMKQTLDYETSVHKEWTATIRSTDMDGLYVDASFTFKLIDENDPPRSAKLVPNTIPENSPKGSNIGCFQVQEDDVGQNSTVYLLTGNKIFELYKKNETFCLRVLVESSPDCPSLGGKICALNFEVQSQQYIAVMVKDNGVPSAVSYFDIGINITDINEPITGVTLTSSGVPENVQPGQALLQLVATDEDKGAQHKFEILEDPTGLFKIINDTLVASVSFDYEVNPTIKYTIKVRGTDLSPPVTFVDVNVTFGVQDVNEPPYTLQLTSINSLNDYPPNQPQVKENVPAVIVGTVSVYDPDKGDNITLSLNSTKFRLMNSKCTVMLTNNTNYCTARILNLAGFNYEEFPSVPLKITAQDGSRLTTILDVNITVINMDDLPTDILINDDTTPNISVPENSKNITVGEVKAVDEDVLDKYTYFLSGSAANQFKMDGSFLWTSSAANLEYETVDPLQQLIITAISITRSSMSVVKTFTIIVKDVNEAPSNILFSRNEVPENSPEGTLVCELSAVDPDNKLAQKQLFTYFLLDDAQGRFYISSNKLYVKNSTQMCGTSTCKLDYEGQKELRMTVKVTDNGMPTLSTNVTQTISVTDANDPPYNLAISSNQVIENKPSGAIIGTLLASDQDKDSIFTFVLLNHTQEFGVTDRVNLVQLSTLDYEAKSVYYIQIQVSDNGLPVQTVVDTIKIEVANINEAPKYIGPEVLAIPENVMMGTNVGAISVEDPDNSDTVEITLKNFKDIFLIGNKQISQKLGGGTLVTANLSSGVIFDYETQAEYSVSLSLIDKQGLDAIYMLKIRIEDQNDPPQDILLNGSSSPQLSIQENTLAFVVVLAAVDQDLSQTHVFSILNQPGDNFTIVGKELKLARILDFENSSAISLTLEVSDSGSPTYKYRKTIAVNVLDVNEPPSDLKLSNNKVDENSVDGTLVGVLQATDPDNKEGFVYSLLDSANGKFRIQDNKILVVSPEQCTSLQQKSCSLNYETQKLYTLRVMVEDNGFPKQSSSFDLKIEVKDANDAPSDILLSGNKVEELAKTNAVIGNLSVSDEDQGQSYIFTLKENAGGSFVLKDNVLVKATDDRLDISKVYSVLIVAQDNGVPAKTAEQTFYISISGVDEAPQKLALGAQGKATQVSSEAISIPENVVAGDVIGRISAQDSDLDQNITFSLVVDEGGLFTLSKNSTCITVSNLVYCNTSLFLALPVNFETKDKYTIILVATDSAKQQSSQTFIIQIVDVGEAPTDITFSSQSISIPENSENIVVGTFTAVDEDLRDTHTFSLKNSIEKIFLISATGQLSVASGAILDYETKNWYDLTVVVIDSTRNIFEKTFKVNVTNVNERPSAVKLISNTIPERSPASTVVGELSTDDPDNMNLNSNSSARQNHEYTLIDNAGGRFELVQSTVKLTVKGADCSVSWCGLDFETQRSHQVQILVVDSGSPRLSSTFALTIQVTDQNDPPVISNPGIMQLMEDMKVGDVVTQLSATDQDVGQSLFFSVETAATNFKVIDSKLVLSRPLDFETNPSLSVEITVTDSGSPALSAKSTFNFKIVNVGEPPTSVSFESVKSATTPSFLADQPVIGESTKSGTLIGQLVAQDPDFDEDLTFLCSGDVIKVYGAGCLSLNKQGTRCVASIILNKILDFETQSSYSLTATAIDKYGLRLDKNFTLQVKDENDPPTAILINNLATDTIKVKENSKGINLATLGAVDPDKNQTFVFAVSGSSFFYIVGNLLKVTTAATIDYELVKMIPIKLKVFDSGQPSLSFEKDFTIAVQDENEAPTSVTLTRNKVSEDAGVGVEVGSFVTEDPDNKEQVRQKFTYELTDSINGIFGVANGSLVVSSARLDYEQSLSYTVKVKVTDDGTPPMSAQFDLEVRVLNENDAPTNLQLSSMTVSESAGVDTLVGIIAAQDPDAGQTLRFTIANSDYFTVKGNQLVVSAGLDFETAPRVIVELTASDDGSPVKSVARNFTITVVDVNEPPVQMNINATLSTKFSIPENTVVNTLIALIETVDPDNIDSASMTLTSASSQNFKLDSSGPTCQKKLIASLGSTFTVCTQKVFLSQTVKYSTPSSPLVLEIISKDKGQLSITNRWEFTILDTNDPPYNISITSPNLEIPENVEKFKLGGLSCDDPDVGQHHFFQILTYWNVFNVDNGSILVTTKGLDFEQQSVYQVTIRCMDDGIPSANVSKTFTVSVKDVNEPPSDTKLSTTAVPQIAKDGEIVSLITVSDPDNTGSNTQKQSHTCVVFKDDTGNFKVSKEGLALQISGGVPVNKTTVKITLNCTDSGVPSLYFIKDIDLIITETADVPKAIVLNGPKTVQENNISTIVGSLALINTLTQTQLSAPQYILSCETKNHEFSIDGSNQIIAVTAFDFEKAEMVGVNVSCFSLDKDGNESELTATFMIKVLDVNEPPQQINIYGGGKLIENSPPGTIIGDLNTLDPEPYQTYSYTLISVAAGLDTTKSSPELLNTFQLNGRTLTVGPNNTALDFESFPIFSVVVQTMDSGDPRLGLNDTIRIMLTDGNDPPTDIFLNNSQIPEDVIVGSFVGAFSVIDQDRNQSHSCVVNNLEAVPFTVDNGLNLQVSRLGIDYEKQKTYVVEVTCQDSGKDGTHLKVSKSLIVNVTNVNEPPYNIMLSTSSINEGNVVQQLVAEISATDPDSQKIFFSLEGNNNFEIQGYGSLVALTVFDYEKVSKYPLTVKATDENGLYALANFEIQVNDINERPTNITLTNDQISESAKRGTLIAKIKTQDPDKAQTFQYTLKETPPANGHFVIVGDRLEFGQSRLNYESSNVYRISITSTDSGTLPQSLTVDFDIKITDSNDPPTAITLNEPLSVIEHAPTNTVLSEVYVEDEDLNQTHSCQIVDKDVPFSFITSINEAIELVVSGEVNFEKFSSYSINISCSDGEFDIFKKVSITVQGINEPPTAIILRGAHYVPANATIPYEVETLDAIDDDVGQTHTFSTIGANSDLFKVQRGNVLVLVKSLPVEVLDHPNPSINVTIHVADSGQPVMTMEQSITLTITDIDIEELKLPDITITNSVVNENAVEGDVVGAIYDQNATVRDSVLFTITADASSLFRIQNNKFLILAKNISTFFGNSAQVTIEAKNTQTQESKSRTITVVVSRSDKCYDNGKTCHENARCIQLNNTEYRCKCNDDFEGDGYLCLQIDDCKRQTNSMQCVHGKCKDDVNSFTCLCNEDYTGQYCELSPPEIDPCKGHLCKNLAACKPTDDKTSYTCECAPGWTGKTCETNIDECSPNPCQVYETCVDGVFSFTCKCPEDKTGHRCQFSKDSCQDNNCSEAEVCVPKLVVKGFICSPKDRVLQLAISCLNDTAQCLSKFLEFVQTNGRFPSRASNLSTSARSRRQVTQLNDYVSLGSAGTPEMSAAQSSRARRQSSLPQNVVTAYLIEYKGQANGTLLVSLLVLDVNYFPFTLTDTLEALEKTCTSISESDQTEKAFCPAILKAYDQHQMLSATTKSPSSHDLEPGGGTTKAPVSPNKESGTSSMHTQSLLFITVIIFFSLVPVKQLCTFPHDM